MKRKMSMFAAFILVVSLLAGCTASDETTAPETGGETTAQTGTEAVEADSTTINIGLADEIVSMDPAYSYDQLTNQVVNQVTQGLLYLDYDNNIQPQLCSEWEAVDATTYVYQIRPDICFSDGSPMTMEDVLYSVQRHMDSNVASYLAWMFANVESIEQTGDWEMTVKLSKPDAAWQYSFATTAGHIIKKEYCEAHPDDFGSPSVGVIGTGPYVLDSWTTGSEIKLKANENYWDTENTPVITDITFRIITDANTQAAALTSGQIDYMLDPPTEMLSTLEEAENLNVSQVEGWTVLFMAMNCQQGPFSDINVRMATAYALDKDSLYESVLQDNGGYAKNGVPFASALYGQEAESWEAFAENAQDYKNDLELAKECMAQSEYPDGFECTLYTNQDSMYNSICLYVQSALSELGITVSIEQLTSDEMYNIQFGSTRDYDLAMVRWTADYPDVTGQLYPLFYSANIAEGGGNTACYDNPEVDALLDEQLASIDLAERTELMQEALTMIGEDCPVVCFDFPYKRIVMNERLTGFEPNASITWNFFVKDLTLAQ